MDETESSSRTPVDMSGDVPVSKNSDIPVDVLTDTLDDVNKDTDIDPAKPNGDDVNDESKSSISETVENHVENNIGSEGCDSQESKIEDIDNSDVDNANNVATENESQPEEVGTDIPSKVAEPSETRQAVEPTEEEVQDAADLATRSTPANDDSQEVNDECQETIKNETKGDSQDESQARDDSLDESQGKEDRLVDESQDNEKSAVDSIKDDDDDIRNPTFENAPELPEQPVEDHSQTLDPFDALLQGGDESTADKTAEAVSAVDSTADTTADLDDDDDNRDVSHHDADDSHDVDDDDVPHDDAPHDAEVEEVPPPGEDEEVCLLPDTEREISEADREKALEASKLLQETPEEHADDVAKPEIESAENAAEEATGAAEMDGDGGVEAEEAAETEAAEADQDVAVEDTTAEGDEGDKTKDADETAEIDESLPPNIIQGIGPVDNPCLQCNQDKPCAFKLLKDNAVKYLCAEDCVKAFQEANEGYIVNNKNNLIIEIAPALMTCSECEEEKFCYFYYNSDGTDTNYCSLECLQSMMADESDKYVFKRRTILVCEIDEIENSCVVCGEPKVRFRFEKYGKTLYLCKDTKCLKKLNDQEGNRYRAKRKTTPRVQVVKKTNIPILKQPLLKLKVISNATDKYLDEGYKIQAKTPAAAAAAREDRERSFIRRCVQCINIVTGDEKNLSWETMDFCNETCLQRYQLQIGSKCANCKSAVNQTSLGKYCVRFGYDIRQFCCSTCLEEFKKGLKICCYCQRDISSGFEGFLAPVGDKGQFKDFCSKQCMAKFEQMSKNPVPQPVWAKCAVCAVSKPTNIEVGIDDKHSQRLCSDPCFAAFKFVNSIFPDQCRWCKKYFERKSNNAFTIYTENATHCYCSRACMNVYISNSRHIAPCNWCKVKKYNFDMIRRTSGGQSIMMCSLNCLNLYQVSVNAITSRRIKCDMCKRTSQAQYHLTMSDATVRNFCTYQCVMSFQSQYSKHPQTVPMGNQAMDQQTAVPTGAPRRTIASANQASINLTPANQTNVHQTRNATAPTKQQGRGALPVISNVQSLASVPTVKIPPISAGTRAKTKRNAAPPPEPEPPRVVTPPPPAKPLTPPPPPPPKIYNHVLVKTLPPAQVANKATMTKPASVSKGVSCRPHPCTKECQTDPSLERRILVPVPVPIYVPVPIAMYSLPFPIPVPIPLPVPTPVFVPTTRNSAKGILKEITKIHDKMPTDPFEAELLMMAEMVAGDKKKSESDSETDDENDEGFSPDAMDGGNAFGEDMLQMALKMASEYEEPAVDLESAMTASTITPSSHPGMPGLEGEAAMHHHHQMMVLEQQRAVAALRAHQTAAAPASRGKRAPAAAAAAVGRSSRSGKRSRRQEPAPPPPEPVREPVEKPDANMCLKYTFGVNAWKQWVMTKNAEIEKSSIRRKPFKSEILQLTADELNYSLCLFVKEVRKPNGSEYAPDTIYYLVLGIQQYLFENGRIDNIFTDPYYEKFTECLDEVARKFSVLYNDSQYIVTRVEEEHLWESKQLGAHSPHVLLSTLMFFNTKHFNLVTVEEHMQLSFSHIMKHWKRSPNQPGAAKMPGSRNVLLRFYPPQSALEANSRKKKVYEQQENEENPLRCPVKLYEFYISKCPESVRTRNDVFYLQPERSCVPDSPVWYSTQALGRDALAKMLHRVKMVKEINIALLTS